MIQPKKGLKVTCIEPSSPAFRAGLRKGDRIVAVSGEPVGDELELRFFSAQADIALEYYRKNVLHQSEAHRGQSEELGITVVPAPIKKCANRCLFCFVDQMPTGLRRSLYVKDEDYRYSFTNGNYITLSCVGHDELARIAQLGLSPLYISVHATIPSVRKKLLGNSRAGDIMGQLRFLSKHYIRFHTQIVVCPGINDGAVLKKTIAELLSFKEDLLSIAVVPVGLTRHRAAPLSPVTRQSALRLCREAGRVGDAQVKAQGRRVVFCADELFVKAGLPIPDKSYYEDYPQIENGVGLVRQLMEQWRELKKTIKANIRLKGAGSESKHSGAYLAITSLSASSFVTMILREIGSFFPGIEIKVAVVRNDFFGRTVTVAGLLTATDVLRAVHAQGGRYSGVFLPDVMFNANGVTLDGFSPQRIERRLGMKIKVISTLSQIVEIVRGKQ